ncbi:hypothetical protein [Amycolatopsis sp. NPDC051128]|uniref:hypothetical protein n=1 Tax=Amycolatopsis sp. NPDC051128 TaxID=3155412 RepID=UPI0034200807
MSFRLALRQDHGRWLREQRAELYVDLLTEAYAEQQWIEMHMADEEVRERFGSHYTDLRLPPLERARLGVRATMYGSRTVNALFNRIPAEAFWGRPLGSPPDDGDRIAMRVRVGAIGDALQDAIRREMRTDDLLPNAQSTLLGAPHPVDRAPRTKPAPPPPPSSPEDV